MLKHVDAVGKRLLSLHSTRCIVNNGFNELNPKLEINGQIEKDRYTDRLLITETYIHSSIPWSTLTTGYKS